MKFNRLIPELSVSSLTRSLEFYADVLEFKVEYDRPEDKFAFLSYQDSQIMIEEINGHWETGELRYPFGRGVNFQFHVDDADSLLSSLAAHGYPLFRPVRESWYRGGDVLHGQKEFLVQDPDGYLLRFAQDLGSRPA